MDIIGEWQENDFCSFVEAECKQCVFMYWFVKRDGRQTLRDRDKDDTIESFEQRSSDIR